ncbi:hypothetical protein ACOMHN_039458 [Nucella lapillus]
MAVVVVPTNGPVALQGWTYSSEGMPCYSDWCSRKPPYQFCNHREMRCQPCERRESQCGNLSSVPWECDIHCLALKFKKDMEDRESLVSPGYMHSTYILLALLPGLLLALAVAAVYCRYKGYRVSTSIPSSHTSESGENLSLLSASSTNTEDKEAQTDEQHAVPQDEPLHLPQPTAPSPPPAHDLPTPTSCHDHRLQNPGHPHPPPAQPTLPPPQPAGQDDTILLTRETVQPFSHDAPRPGPAQCPANPNNIRNNPTNIQPEDHPTTRVKMPFGGAPPEASREALNHCPNYPGPCRDPRLDNICPVAEADRDVRPERCHHQPANGCA